MTMTATVQRVIPGPDWDRQLDGFAQRPLYASSVWAAYKQRHGWTPCGLALSGPTGVRAALLAQTRRLTPLGPTLCLIQGGPLLAPGEDAARALPALLAAANPGRLGVEVLLPAQALSHDVVAALPALGFREVAIAGTGTVLLDLDRDEPGLRAALSKNWRHNLNRAEKRDLEIRWIGRSKDERAAAAARMAEMYRALTQRKAFAGALDADVLAAAMADDDRMEWLEVWKDGTLLASRIGWIGGTTALDLLAASSDAAKTTYANYLALWALINRSRERGARRFDCGGIDPSGNEGVYNFKKGLSGEEVALGRMWLRTRPGMLWPLIAGRLAGRVGA